MTAAEKKELVSYLKHGDKKLICTLAGVHETVMYAWISGRLKSSSIEPYVIQLAKQRKRELEAQTGETIQEPLIDSEIIIDENFQLKTELKLMEKEIRKYRKLLSSKNRIYNECFSKLKKYIDKAELSVIQKTKTLEIVRQFQADFSFLNHYEKYADILTSVNPIFSKWLDEIDPGFSVIEKQMLSMFKLHLSDREIGMILAVSDDFVRQSILRLRKKLGAKPEADLSDFINSL